jgi:acetyl/propionyl-CoA carboxylase alpha subunit
LDVGVDQGDEVSPFYDPMLGKLIAWGDSRDAAIEGLRRALRELEISGVTTNRALLVSVLGDARFRSGSIATDFIDSRRAELEFGEPAAGDVDALLAALWSTTARPESRDLWTATIGWRLGAPAISRWNFGKLRVSIEALGGALYRASVAQRSYSLRLLVRSADALQVEIDGALERVGVYANGADIELFRDGRHTRLRALATEDSLQATLQADAGSLLTPLPGTVVAVHVTDGQAVARGAPLVTIEAMKMEHTVTAPYAGTVARLPFALGDRVAAGAVLVELAPNAS